MLKFVESLVIKHKIDESFYIANIKLLNDKIQEWRAFLPNVHPFYAMKCNPDKEILKTMIGEGFGFDAASKHEIATILDLGCKPDNIVYANPVKTIKDIQYATSRGIKYTTFDSISELCKLYDHAPGMQYLIRLKVDNPTARVQLGLKYGVARDDYKYLIDAAENMKLNIVGTSIHVGSGTKDASVFADGISYCREVLDYMKTRGFSPNILDIGGGFTKETFKDCAKVITDSIYKENLHDYRIIAEPGRYFAEEIYEFYTPIIGQKTKNCKNEYWIGDGLYGSFNSMLYDAHKPEYEVFRNPLLEMYIESGEFLESVVWGCSCDSEDRLGNVMLPKLRNGDFLRIKNFGAYTLSAATDFNGINMTKPSIFYTQSPKLPQSRNQIQMYLTGGPEAAESWGMGTPLNHVTRRTPMTPMTPMTKILMTRRTPMTSITRR